MRVTIYYTGASKICAQRQQVNEGFRVFPTAPSNLSKKRNHFSVKIASMCVPNSIYLSAVKRAPLALLSLYISQQKK